MNRHVTISKTRIPICLALLTIVAGLALLGGCRDGLEMSAADKALAANRALPPEEREADLRAMAHGDTALARYAWYELGNIYYDMAQERIETPAEDSPTRTNALLDSALVYYETASVQDSTFFEPLVNMGRIWDDLSEGRTAQARQALQNAIELYQRALVVNPADDKARCNLGSLYYQRHQYNEAIGEYRTALEHNPESALAHYHLAIMFAESKMTREAIVEWEAAAKYDRDGDIGERSRENIRVMHELMNSEIPENVKGDGGH